MISMMYKKYPMIFEIGQWQKPSINETIKLNYPSHFASDRGWNGFADHPNEQDRCLH